MDLGCLPDIGTRAFSAILHIALSFSAGGGHVMPKSLRLWADNVTIHPLMVDSLSNMPTRHHSGFAIMRFSSLQDNSRLFSVLCAPKWPTLQTFWGSLQYGVASNEFVIFP